MTLKDSAIHKSYHKIRNTKKFVPVSEDYLYKRKKGIKTYRNNYLEKKKQQDNYDSYYNSILEQRKRSKKKKKRSKLTSKSINSYP